MNVDSELKQLLWQQFGAAIDMLENAVTMCPDEVWATRPADPQSAHDFWYLVYHTLFWTDFNLSDLPQGFAPPATYNLDEMDPRGLYPDRIYSKSEMQAYLEHCREKCRTKISGLTDEKAGARFVTGKRDFSVLETYIYNLRHVQHHTAQLNLILRQKIDSAPRWVSKTKRELNAF